MKKGFSLALVFCLFSFTSVLAMSPDDYCEIHDESGAPGVCDTTDECVVLTTNLGTEECKLCTDGGCELTDCSECE